MFCTYLTVMIHDIILSKCLWNTALPPPAPPALPPAAINAPLFETEAGLDTPGRGSEMLIAGAPPPGFRQAHHPGLHLKEFRIYNVYKLNRSIVFDEIIL